MRFALPKNRTTPLIIFAILGMIVSLAIGLYHMNHMAQYSYQSQYEDYAFLTENAAALIKQEVEHTYQSLQSSAGYLSNAAEWDKNTITQFLTQRIHISIWLLLMQAELDLIQQEKRWISPVRNIFQLQWKEGKAHRIL
jgi:predicted AlkP superfamily phosphohydrolase/phosphomutase